jgi:hypothetical protein
MMRLEVLRLARAVCALVIVVAVGYLVAVDGFSWANAAEAFR